MLGTRLHAGQWRSRDDVGGLDSWSMHRSVSATTLFAACLMLFGFGCSEEPPAHFAPGSYGATHRTEIENDCDKRVICAQRTNMFLREDAFEHCVSTNATNLNDSPGDPLADEAFRLKFALGLVRCTQPDACQYVACMNSEYESYGQAQIDKVKFACQQSLQCGTATGSIAVDAATYYESCQVQSVVALDAFPSEARTNFQAQYFACMSQLGCAFQMCFGF